MLRTRALAHFFAVKAAALQLPQIRRPQRRQHVRESPATRAASGFMGQRPECPSARKAFTQRPPECQALIHLWAAAVPPQWSECLPVPKEFLWLQRLRRAPV